MQVNNGPLKPLMSIHCSFNIIFILLKTYVRKKQLRHAPLVIIACFQFNNLSL